MNYQETFITLSPDSPVSESIVPTAKGESKTVHLIQYELLTQHPYTYTGQELIFQTHVQRLGLSETEIEARRDEIWHELFSKDHACLRSSTLAKKYGWGFHFDSEGHIGIYAVESPEYQQMSSAADLKVIPAMRSKRA